MIVMNTYTEGKKDWEEAETRRGSGGGDGSDRNGMRNWGLTGKGKGKGQHRKMGGMNKKRA
jgi:hypothetical protein